MSNVDGTIQESNIVPQSVKDSIFGYRFKHFLKIMGKSQSGNTDQRIARIQENLQNRVFKGAFLDFLVDELGNGKTRQIFISRFEIRNLDVLKYTASVKSNLSASGLPFENFNDLLRVDPVDEDLLYLNIEKYGENDTFIRRIKMCFYKEIEPSEGFVGKRSKFTDYIWVEIFPEDQLLLIKLPPHTQQYMVNFYTSKNTRDEIFLRLQKIFPLTVMNMLYTKEVLYTIFKELTEIAEQPYRDGIMKYEQDIDRFHSELLPLIGLPESDFQEIKTRYIRLLERNLILNDLENYQSYHQNRIGVVSRIALTDLSGATANVLSGDADGLDVADFYFDIRETIDHMKKLDKLWVKWFLIGPEKVDQPDEEQMEIEEEELEDEVALEVSKDEENSIETRFEVTKDYVIINFTKKFFVSKGVQDYVLSRFIEFEEKTSQRS